jgi:hypothetical protein
MTIAIASAHPPQHGFPSGRDFPRPYFFQARIARERVKKDAAADS